MRTVNRNQSVSKSIFAIVAMALVIGNRYIDGIAYCSLWLASVYIFAQLLAAFQLGKF